MDLDSWDQNATFIFQMFFEIFFMFLLKNGFSLSAKEFRKVDLYLWGQNATFFFQAFFDKNFYVFVKKQHFTKC
jgi:hypothetical protein